jgi:hypothetical protein
MLMRALAIVFAVAGGVCWLFPGAITALFSLTVSLKESIIIGAPFFVAAAVLWFIRPPDDTRYRSRKK